MYHSLAVLSAILTCDGETLFAFTVEFQEVFNVPDVKSLDAANQKFTSNSSVLSFASAVAVSPSKVKVFFSQVLADEIVYVWE